MQKDKKFIFDPTIVNVCSNASHMGKSFEIYLTGKVNRRRIYSLLSFFVLSIFNCNIILLLDNLLRYTSYTKGSQ